MYLFYMIITAFIFVAPLCVLLHRKAGGDITVIPMSQVRMSQEHNGLLVEQALSGPGTEAVSQQRERRGALCPSGVVSSFFSMVCVCLQKGLQVCLGNTKS